MGHTLWRAVYRAALELSRLPNYSTFIVRIWPSDSNGLHGEITHVASQEKRVFRDLNLVVEFMVEYARRFEGPEGCAERGESGEET